MNLAAASGIEPDSDTLTAWRIALMLDGKKWSGMRESNPPGVGGSHEPSRSAKPAHSRPELLNNSGDWFRGLGVRAGPALIFGPGVHRGHARSGRCTIGFRAKARCPR